MRNTKSIFAAVIAVCGIYLASNAARADTATFTMGTTITGGNPSLTFYDAETGTISATVTGTRGGNSAEVFEGLEGLGVGGGGDLEPYQINGFNAGTILHPNYENETLTLTMSQEVTFVALIFDRVDSTDQATLQLDSNTPSGIINLYDDSNHDIFGSATLNLSPVTLAGGDTGTALSISSTDRNDQYSLWQMVVSYSSSAPAATVPSPAASIGGAALLGILGASKIRRLRISK